MRRQTFDRAEYMTAVYTLVTWNLPIQWKKGKAVKLCSLMYLKCSSPVFVYSQDFIYSRGPDTLGSGGGGNDSCWWTMLRSTASPCLGSTWWICRRTGPPYWPGADWHMSGEGGVRKRGGKVTDLLISVIKCSSFPPSALEGQKTSATMPPPNLSPSYPLGAWLAWMPATPAHSTARPTLKNKPKTNNTNLSTAAPLWATHSVTNKLKYH